MTPRGGHVELIIAANADIDYADYYRELARFANVITPRDSET